MYCSWGNSSNVPVNNQVCISITKTVVEHAVYTYCIIYTRVYILDAHLSLYSCFVLFWFESAGESVKNRRGEE